MWVLTLSCLYKHGIGHLGKMHSVLFTVSECVNQMMTGHVAPGKPGVPHPVPKKSCHSQLTTDQHYKVKLAFDLLTHNAILDSPLER